MELQRIIGTELSKSNSMPDKLEKILKNFVDSLHVDSAALYATVDENYLEFMGGFHVHAYKSNVRFNEGGIGKSAAFKRTVVEAHEDAVLMAIPIIRMNLTLGVLVAYKKNTETFADSEIEYAETLALAFPELMYGDAFIDYRNQVIREKGMVVRDVLHGVSLNKGYGVGKAVLHHRRRELINIFSENIELEKSKLLEAREKMVAYIDRKIAQTANFVGDTTDIMETYRMFAMDKGWYKKITADIEKGYTADAAIEHVYEEMRAKLSTSDDSYLRERVYDLRDISDRLRAFLDGHESQMEVLPDEDIVIIAQTMGPADLMDYDYQRIRGLILEDCTPTMHVVIVAKALNIPVIAKIHSILKEVKIGEKIALNGHTANVYLHPSEQLMTEYQKKSVGLKKVFAELEQLSKLPTQTLDGTRITLAMNYGLDLDFDYIKPTKCDGIGLYRTEITFMSAEKMPDVNQQVRQYKRLFEALGNKKIVFRSLDVGSDKFLPYWGEMKEDNPAIGWRSIRITLDRRAILRQQMRAMLRAAENKDLYVMFPMISNLQEFLAAKETLLLEYEREKQNNKPTAKKVYVGMMVEVPSVLFQLDELLRCVDFISVGTNDLYQFMYACDRSNPRLIERYDILSVPFLRVLKMIVDKATQYKVYCSVCGEMASNPLEAMALIGLGYRNLSVSGSAFARVKKMINSMEVETVDDYIKNLLKTSRISVRPQLLTYAYDHGIEID